jgi:hypothetical protein
VLLGPNQQGPVLHRAEWAARGLVTGVNGRLPLGRVQEIGDGAVWGCSLEGGFDNYMGNL